MSFLGEEDLPTLEEFELLFEDKAFVDHLNIFLCQPVFGQQVVYSFIEKEFEFDPPIRRRRYFVHRRAVINWIRQERYPYFRLTKLHVEYLLCCRLRDVGFFVQDAEGNNLTETPDSTRVFTENLLSHVVGMQMFRESLRNTSGERVFNCWMDIELFRRSSAKNRRRQYHHLKAQYLVDGAPQQLGGKTKCLFHFGKLNFEIVARNIQQLIDTLLQLPYNDSNFQVDSDEAMSTLQGLLLEALRCYWVPRHVLHVLSSMSPKQLQPLFSRSGIDEVPVEEVDRMVRYRRMFPKVLLTDPEVFSCSTAVFNSNNENDDPRYPTPKAVSTSKDIRPEDLLSLWGGTPLRPVTEEVATVGTMSRPWSAVSWAFNDDSIISESPDLDAVESPWGDSPSPEVEYDLKTPSGSSISNLLNKTSSLHMRDSSLSRMILSSIERQKFKNMPLLLQNYILGKRDCDANAPRVSNRILCALASDKLAGKPFMNFLKQKRLDLDANYLNFWLDVRSYLRTDEGKVDRHGNNCKRILARSIAEKYLMSSREEDESIFSEGLKFALLDTLSLGDDESLLYAAHDIVSSTLNISWRRFVTVDRRKFVRQACGKRLMNYINSFQSPPPRAPYPGDNKPDPLYFGEARQRIQSAIGSECSSDPASPVPPTFCGSSMVKPLGDEHRARAFECAIVMIEEMALMGPLATTTDVINCVTSCIGSLNIVGNDITRQDELKELMKPEKIDIETIKVSRKVLLPKIELIPTDKPLGNLAPRGARMILRRNGVILNLPNKPRSFMEVLSDGQHFEFFKRFLMARKVTTPLQFWKAVEDMKETPNSKARHMKTGHIFRRFFGKQAKNGATLECSDEVIRQIPFMTTITPGMMVCAQASIYRMMERKWYPAYLETFPAESDIRPVSPTASMMFNIPSVGEEIPLVSEWLPRRRMQKKKTFHLWQGFITIITAFLRSLKIPAEVQLFEIFLRKELDRMSPSEKLMETREVGRGRDSIAYDSSLSTMTRVVVRNKVVVINKLPRDLQFWLEVARFRQQIDGINNSGSYDKSDGEMLLEKAKAIVTCFLASEVPPRVQINIPSDLALSIMNSVNIVGPHRGLFHDACVMLFPTLYHFWRRFSMEWLDKDDAEVLLERIRENEKGDDLPVPHKDEMPPDFTRATVKDIKTFLVPGADEDTFRINFTLLTGIRLLLPKPKGNYKTGDRGGEGEDTFEDMSPQKYRFGARSSIASVGSQYSVGKLNKRLSTHAENGGSGTSMTPNSKNDPTRSSGRESAHLTPGELAKNKARRLSALVEGLNITKPIPSPDPAHAGRRVSRTMRNIHDVLAMAQAFGPTDEGDSPVF